jgi:hypothetical protein
VGHASVGAPLPSGGALFARIGAALFAILVPVFLLLAQLKSGDQAIKGWKDYHRIDIVVLILAVVTVVCIVASLRSVAPVLPTIAAALAFAMFGLVLGFPMEFASQAGDSANVKIGIGAVLAFLSALLSGILSIWVAAVTKPAADGGLIGAGRGASALNRQPAAPTGVPQQPAQAASGAAPGWYPDPNGVARLRYFDGINWTDQTGN